MKRKIIFSIATILLIFAFTIAVLSIRNDSTTMDEVAHLPGGYSYVTQQDMRINPEHPPLIKDFAGIPLLFIDGISFPDHIKAWREEVNGQWEFGYHFLYHSGNPVDKMVFWGRIPMIMIMVLLGYYVFRWSRELFNDKTALLALFLFCLSPTILAHTRLVTTDVGAAAGAFIGLYYFVKFLKNSSNVNLVKAGIALGLAELAKFSLILLFPTIGLLVIAWAAAKSFYFKQFLKVFIRYALQTALIVVICFLVIWAVYQFHTLNYPPERQVSDTAYNLSTFGSEIAVNTVIWSADKPILRPLSQYFHGLLMVLQRVSGGNTTYFLGQVSRTSWRSYFPIVYLIKEPLALHILSIIALLYAVWFIKKPFWQKPIKRIRDWLSLHIAEFAMLLFVLVYWATSLSGNLNLGVRHLLPVIPFTIVLVSAMIIKWLKPPFVKLKKTFLVLLLIWQAVSVVAVYPHFLAYFNELVGGPNNGHIYAVDSNLDWGQDLRRLKDWTEKNEINEIYIDYFGGGQPKYYFGEKYKPWWGTRNPNEMPKGSYLAVSATFLQGGQGKPVEGFDQDYGYYNWLNNHELVEKIGYSIFVFYID